MASKATSRVHLFGLAGSLRRDSYSRAVLRGMKARLAPDIGFTIHDPRLPLYDEDEDGAAATQTVKRFRAAIAASHGIVIATPEYNHGMPGVLKNALDWASRPRDAAALADKPALVMSLSPAFTGGARAHSQVNETLLAARARVIGGPQVVIGNVADKVVDGCLVDDASLAFALAALGRMIESIRPLAITRSSLLQLQTQELGTIDA